MMNQQVNSDSIVSVKATLLSTNENRFVALPSPASFALLANKLSTTFGLDAGAFRVQYVDDEGDRVTVSSDDELACALSLVPARRPLCLFIAAAPAPVQQQAKEHLTTTIKLESQPATTTTTDNDQPNVDAEQEACPEDKDDKDTTLPATAAALDHLKVKLAAAGVTVSDDGKAGVCEKRCLRVVARFDGDLDKALAAIECIHERKQLRLVGKKPRPDLVQLEAIQEQRQARRNERIAARLARQELKKSRASACDESACPRGKADAEAIDSLLAFMTEQGLAVGRGRCTGALRRSNGDVGAAKAELLAWSAKGQQQRKDQKTTSSTNDVNESEGYDKEQLLGQLDQLGFGTITNTSHQANNDGKQAANQGPERIRRRNKRLLKRFDGDVAQVVGFLEARKAKVEARVAARQARQAQHGRGRRAQVQLADEGAKATSAC